MSCPVNLAALPSGVFEEVFTPENLRGRATGNPLTQLSFPKSRSALWDGSPAGEMLHLQFCSNRKPRLLLLEKALRLAQRHARHLNKPRLHCFFLGSLRVDGDEEGVTVTLDRFDPGREQAGAVGRVPMVAMPGDVVVPCLFSAQAETSSDAAVQSEAELHQCFKALQQLVSSRQALDLSQLLKVKGHVFCRPQSDAAAFSLSWSIICPAVGLDTQPVRPIPIIPTALLRSLTSVARPPPSPLASNHQRGFLTMDQTRKLLLLLESDPKASSLPLVGLWLSGVAHVSNPQVWAWCLRFLFCSALRDRVFSESGCFLLVVFASTHRGPQFYQCQGPRPGPGLESPQLDCQLLSASQSLTLYQVASAEGRTLQCELSAEPHSRQTQVFRAAQSSFSSSASPPAALSLTDQDSGVDEDLSPRPSPSPHLPAQQARRVQPSVPELSLLMDSSFTSNHGKRQDVSSAHKPSPAPLRPPSPAAATHPADRKSFPTTGHAPQPAAAPHQLHSTPNSNLQQPCGCCSHAYDCTSIFSSNLRPSTAATSHQATPPQPSPSHYNTPPPPAPSYQATPPPLTPSHQATPPPLTPSHQATRSPPAPSNQATPPRLTPSHQATPPLLTPSHQATPPPPAPSYQATPPSSSHPRPQPAAPCAQPTPAHRTPPHVLSPPSTHLPDVSSPPFIVHHHHQPAYLGPAPQAACPCGRAAAIPFYGDSPSRHPPSPPSTPYPSCASQQQQAGAQPDTYQLLLQQDRQLRLLQAQVQMLLEAQGKLQVEAQEMRSTASIAVGTGASLFWGNPIQTLPRQEVQTPPPSNLSPASSPRSLPTPASCSPRPPTPVSHELSTNRPLPPPASCSARPPTPSSQELSVNRAVGGAEDGELAGQDTQCSPSSQCSVDGPQSPVLGESASMYGPACEQQSFYQNLMIQLNSRLQEPDCQQEEESPVGRGRSLSEVSDASRSSGRKHQSREGDPVVGATLRRLQQLGVDVDKHGVSESDRRLSDAVESSSTLACINPAAVVSRLSASEPTASVLFPGGSNDLSLEANAIALRYLSDSQLSRLAVGVHLPPPGSASSTTSLLSPSNMSLATRKYMRRCGLIEEEDGEEEEEEEEEDDRVTSARLPLAETLNVKPLPQSQLIRDLKPKMQLLANGAKENADKENRSSRRPSLVRAGSRQPEGSVGNILDLSRLRQLPKLF